MFKFLFLLKSCFNLLDKKRKKIVFVFSFLSFLGSILEMLALIGVMPFVTFIIEPKLVTSHKIYKSMTDYTGPISSENLIILLL